MRLVNSLKYGLVIVLDPYDIAFGKRVSNDPKYQNKKLYGPVELKSHIRIFDELMGNVPVNVVNYEPHTIPVLMAGAIIDGDEDYLSNLCMVFNAYMQMKSYQWDYIYIEEMFFYVIQQACRKGFASGITEEFVKGYFCSLIDDDDLETK